MPLHNYKRKEAQGVGIDAKLIRFHLQLALDSFETLDTEPAFEAAKSGMEFLLNRLEHVDGTNNAITKAQITG